MGISSSRKKSERGGYVVRAGRQTVSSKNPSFSSGSDGEDHSPTKPDSGMEALVTTEAVPKSGAKRTPIRGSTRTRPVGNDAAAQWRLRVTTRNAKFNRLQGHGALAVVACGSLLYYSSDGRVAPLESFSSWKATLFASPMYNAIALNRRGALTQAKKQAYKRLESAIKSFGQMICLGCEDTDNTELVVAFSLFKKWAVEEGIKALHQDLIIETLKWLGKVCQAIFLGSQIPEKPAKVLERDGILFPFDGPLRFISDLYYQKRDRSNGLLLEEGRTLAQIGSVARSLPYPSPRQISQSVEDTISVLTFPPGPPKVQALKIHTKSVMKIINPIRVDRSTRTHISLSNSAAEEASRSDGGRAGHIVKAAHRAADILVTPIVLKDLSGRVDCFGEILINPIVALLAEKHLEKFPNEEIFLGDLLYADVPLLYSIIAERKLKPSLVPRELAKLLINTACLQVLRFGHYDQPHQTIYSLLSFDPSMKGNLIRFRMDRKTIPVRASLSIEAGLKTRLVTAAPAAVTLLGQLVGNKARSTLSNDAFMRIGFEESEKLWEVLKAYQRTSALKSLREFKPNS